MLSQLYNYLSNYQKGLLLVVTGSILLLYTFGLAQYILGFLVFASAIALVIEGINKMQYHRQIILIFKKYTQPKK